MDLICLDMEGVLVPEIWIAFAEASGIPELKRTTRDEPDYDKLETIAVENDAYYGSVSPLAIIFTNRKKPAMIADYNL